jgi:hypothetical protein
VRAPSRLDGTYALGRERSIAMQKLRIFARKNVVRHYAKANPIAQRAAERQYEGSLAAPDRAANPNREGSLLVVSPRPGLTVTKKSAMARMIVRVGMPVAGATEIAVVVLLVIVGHGIPQL